MLLFWAGLCSCRIVVQRNERLGVLMKPLPALYFDVTDVVEYAMVNHTVTGIQRCVLNILESAVRQGAGRPVYGLVKHPLTNAFKLASLEFMHGSYSLRDFALRFELPTGKALWFARKLRKYREASFKRAFRGCGLHIQWAASSRLRARNAALSSETQPSCLMDLELVPGSAIVSLGAGWATDYTGVESLARRNGCKVVSFVHDIFAITCPQLTGLADKKKNARFRKWLDEAARRSDLLICNSQFTKMQVERHLMRGNITAAIAVADFPHEFKSAAGQAQVIRSEIADLAQNEFILCVGTIEVRKNILELLQAWNAIQSKRENLPHLVLAGRKGWNVRNVYSFLRRTANVGGTVKIIDKPSDAELEFLYRKCAFTVFPSLFEGWGLPIGESLWFGKPVICAANASMPEVGGSYATYFNHDEPGSLLAALERMLDKPVRLPMDIRSHLTTWDGAASSICFAIDASGHGAC